MLWEYYSNQVMFIVILILVAIVAGFYFAPEITGNTIKLGAGVLKNGSGSILGGIKKGIILFIEGAKM